MRVLCVASILMVIGVGVLIGSERGIPNQNRSVDLTCVNSDEGPLVQVRFGDVILVAKELAFEHDDGSKTRVKANDGNVELQNGTSKMVAKKISSSSENGFFGRLGKSGTILKAQTSAATKPSDK